jgi:hypothetical protein
MRLLGALAFAAICLVAIAARPGALRAADPVAPAPELSAFDGPFTRNLVVDLHFVAPDEGGPVAQYRASNDDATTNGVLTNGVSVTGVGPWTLASGADGPRTVYGQVKYESGLWSPVASLELTLDRTPSSSIAVDIDGAETRITAPAGTDWHTRTATPAQRIYAQGSDDGTPDPRSVGAGDDQHWINLLLADGPMAPGTYDVRKAGESGCEEACATVGVVGHICEATDGSFTVTDVAFTPDGDVTVLDADFRFACVDSLMSGSIRYGSARDILALDQDRERLKFPEQVIGDGSNQFVSFTNIGTTATTLGMAEVVGGDQADYAITDDDCSGATLAVGASCDVGIRFTPSAVGDRRASLEIPDETPRGSRHLPLVGSGAAATPPTAGTIVVNGGDRCTDTRSVKVRATGATDAVGIDRLELSNAAADGFKTKRIDPPQRWTLSDGDGRKRVYARWWNAAGLSSAVVKDGILLDTTDPEATAPTARIRGGDRVVNGLVRVRLRWSGSDATCGIKRYVLGVVRNGNDLGRSGDPTALTRTARDLRVGPTYEFRVRAIDKAGNASRWMAGETFRIVGTKANPRIEIVGP